MDDAYFYVPVAVLLVLAALIGGIVAWIHWPKSRRDAAAAAAAAHHASQPLERQHSRSTSVSSLTPSDEARIRHFFNPLRSHNEMTSLETYSEYSRRRGMTEQLDHTVSLPLYMHARHHSPSMRPQQLARVQDWSARVEGVARPSNAWFPGDPPQDTPLDMDEATVVAGQSNVSDSPPNGGGLPMVYAHRDLARLQIQPELVLPPPARVSGERQRRTTLSGGALGNMRQLGARYTQHRYTNHNLAIDTSGALLTVVGGDTGASVTPASSNASMIVGSVRSRIGLEERIRADSNRDTDIVRVR